MDKKNTIQEELEKRIIHGLASEWEAALWVPGASYIKLMKMPLIRLSDMKAQLGSWSEEKREICLSRSFVLNHPWDAVQEVLIHEIAHQFVAEILKVKNEAPHGPSFQHACHLLRANPKASGNYKPLQCRLEKELNHSQDRIMLRIKKLMALAESHNQHEAESAMAKSRELIKKYNIDILKQNKKRWFRSIFVGKPALRHFREAYYLSHLLIDFYFVKGLWVSAYVLEKGKMGRVLEISGTVRNLKIASYVYDFVNNYIDAKWCEYNKEKQLNRYRKTDFAIGIIEGFRSKLETQEQVEQPTASNTLVVIEDPELGDYIRYKYPCVTRFSRGGARQDENVLTDGMDIGKKMVISKGITEKADGRTFLIENHGR
ncbi:MAG: DUF2786 domain-containing protein [Desulfobacula sp.]|nr:DUF2786 domain-containing protein [Desulfobacula sp.]